MLISIPKGDRRVLCCGYVHLSARAGGGLKKAADHASFPRPGAGLVDGYGPCAGHQTWVPRESSERVLLTSELSLQLRFILYQI